jgi:outer membrane cobalamin receptor
VYADWTSTSTVTGCSVKEGPEGKEVAVYIRGAKTFSVTVRVSGIRIVVRIIYSSFYRIT